MPPQLGVAIVIVLIIVIILATYWKSIFPSDVISGSVPPGSIPSGPGPNGPPIDIGGGGADGATHSNNPFDCQTGSWSEWSDCDLPCGGGSRRRTREILRQATANGRACPASDEVEPCNVIPCDIDCKAGDWSEWGQCSTECGPGVRSRSRTVTTQKQGGGADCPPLKEIVDCGNQPCPINCVVGDWSEWTDCSKQCGGGVQRRSRPILIKDANGGQACPALDDERPCNTDACPIDCTVDDWSEWGQCSTSCGPGSRTRTRSIRTPREGSGADCPPLSETTDCGNQPCPTDCVVSEWSEWTPCDLSCGGGSSMRTRTIISSPANGGIDCPSLIQVKPCNNQACDKDCEVSDWSPWSACDVGCGGGNSTRVRYIISPASGAGAACPVLIDHQECNTDACPTDCVVSPWSEWSTCSKECGSGIQTRTRTVISPSTYGSCPSLSESRPCNYQECPVHCEVSDWSNWSECDEVYGGGSQIRTRDILSYPNSTGNPCPTLMDVRDCGVGIQDANDYIVGPWSEWSACGVCGNQTQSRTRTVLRNGSPDRPVPPLIQVRPCANKQCPTQCVVSDWSDWSECTATCGGGVQHRTRFILKYPENTTDLCPPLVETRECNGQPCAVDCQLSAWSDWTQCSKACEGGVRTRSRTVNVAAAYGGAACGALKEQEPCNVQVCDRDCTVYDWSASSACSAACGPGTATRTRNIRQASTGNGAPCPSLEDTVDCNNQPCPIDCAVSEWSDWGACSVGCGGGIQTRSRTVVTQPQYGGQSCPALSESQSCNTQVCDRDCVVSDWSLASECSTRCGPGTQQLSRFIITEPAGNGVACPELSMIRDCPNNPPCPIDCAVDDWTGWGACSSGCGGGVQTRTRNVTTQPQYGGLGCPSLADNQACNIQPCPVDCVEDEWSAWSGCSAECDGGLMQMTRGVKVVPANGGRACGELIKHQPCNIQPCPRPFLISNYPNWGLTVLNQDIRSGQDVILNMGYNSWIYGADQTIRLSSNPNLGLTVLNQSYYNGSPIILHEGMNRWSYSPGGAILLIGPDGNPLMQNGHYWGITLLNQDPWSHGGDGGRMILHEGYNGWNRQ